MPQVQIAPLASDLDVCLVDPPRLADRPGNPPPAFLDIRCVALHPTHNGRMGDRQATLGHHLHQVAQTELESKIPAHAQDDHFAVEVTTLEKLRYRLQVAHRLPQPVQHDSVADPTAPFAPEPQRRFMLPGQNTYWYLDLKPDQMVRDGHRFTRRALLPWVPRRCFGEDDLYTVK